MRKQSMFNRTAMLAATVGVLGLGACRDQGDAAARGETDIEAIKEQAALFRGMTVTVRGEIDDIKSPHVFKVKNRELFGERIWVISPDGTQLTDDTEVLVTGTVRTVTEGEIEREYKLGVTDEVRADLETKVVLVADSVRPAGDA
jgi:hypothetical protein